MPAQPPCGSPSAPARAGAAMVMALALGLGGVPQAAVAASAQVKLIPAVGPPTSSTTVKGRGYGATELVDVAFDGSVLVVAATNLNGAFSTSLGVPSSALPGDHVVSGTGETSGSTAQATFLVRTDAPQFHFDAAHTGSNPYENVLAPENVAGLEVAWTGQTREYAGFSSAIVGGVAYTAAEDHVFAFDAGTGALQWVKPVAGPSASNPAVAGGIVYVGTLGHALYALDAATGRKRFIAPGPTGSPTVVDGVVYAGDNLGSMYAIDARTGARLWAKSISPGHLMIGAPAVVDGVVYAAANAAAGDSVFALDAATGTVLWSVDADSVHGAPAVVDGVVYVGSTALFALDAGTGAVLWSEPIPGTGESAAVAEGLVFISSGPYLQAFLASDGSPLWTTTLTGSLDTPSAANGVVYVGSYDDAIHAFDAATGAELWTYTTGGIVPSAPVIANGYLYVGSFDQLFYAFHLP